MKVRRHTRSGFAWSKIAQWLNPKFWFTRLSSYRQTNAKRSLERGWVKRASEPFDTKQQAPHSSGAKDPTPQQASIPDLSARTPPKPITGTFSSRQVRRVSGVDGRWLFGGTLVGSMLTGYVVAAVFFFPAPFFSSNESVPRVIDLPLEEARATLEAANLVAGDPRRENHPSYTRDHVAWQDPPEGVRVPAGTIVRLAISRGPQEIPVPDVGRYDSDLATTLITRSGLSVSRIDSIQTALPKGVAVGSRPAAGATLAPGSGVILIVSRGAPTISVPDMAGLTLEEAREELARLGLTMGRSWQEFSNAQLEGFIFRQEPPAGTLIAPGTPINVVIARTP